LVRLRNIRRRIILSGVDNDSHSQAGYRLVFIEFFGPKKFNVFKALEMHSSYAKIVLAPGLPSGYKGTSTKEKKMSKASKYTEAMVARLTAEAEKGPLNLAVLTALADEPLFSKADISARGLVAKARTLGLPYAKVERVSKSGEPVVRKDELVDLLEKATGLDGLDSLAKAEKPALRKLVDYLTVTA
jgi:hypothetical protein